jgi:hypothetical protein
VVNHSSSIAEDDVFDSDLSGASGDNCFDNNADIYLRGAALLQNQLGHTENKEGHYSEHLPAHKEETWQRVVLAEQLRLDFTTDVNAMKMIKDDIIESSEEEGPKGSEEEVDETDIMSLQMREFVNYYNSNLPRR